MNRVDKVLLDKLTGHRFELIHDQKVEIFRFPDSTTSANELGLISTIIGQKDGPQAGLCSNFIITGNDELTIQGSLTVEWSKMRFNENKLHVLRNGEPAIYFYQALRITHME